MDHARPRAPVGRAAAALLVLATACTAGRGGASPSPEEIPRLRADLRENPSDVDVMVRLGAAYVEADRPEDARAVLREARRRAPDRGAPVFYLALVHEQAGELEEARDAYGRYLELGGSDRLRERARQRLTLLRRRALLADVRRALEREAEIGERAGGERTVAVFPFRYQGDDPRFRPLGRAMAEFLITDLSRSDRLTVLERTRIQLLLQEMEVSESEYVDPATAVRGGRLLGASNLVQGLLAGGEPELALEASLVDARRPPPEELEPVASGRRPASRIFELEEEVALSVYRSLGIELDDEQREAIGRRPTRDLEAVLAFGRGLMARDTANFRAAARHFREATRIDPGFTSAAEQAEAAEQLSAAAATDVAGLARVAAAEELTTLRSAVAAAARDAAVDRTLLAPLPFDRDPIGEVLGVEGVGSNPAFFRIIVTIPGGSP